MRAHEREGPYVPLSLHVTHEEYLGSERIVYGTIAGGAFDGKKVISRMPATLVTKFEAGGVQAFAVIERHLKFYDRTTGKRTAARPAPEVGAWR
jgi:hypothetical protein